MPFYGLGGSALKPLAPREKGCSSPQCCRECRASHSGTIEMCVSINERATFEKRSGVGENRMYCTPCGEKLPYVELCLIKGRGCFCSLPGVCHLMLTSME